MKRFYVHPFFVGLIVGVILGTAGMYFFVGGDGAAEESRQEGAHAGEGHAGEGHAGEGGAAEAGHAGHGHEEQRVVLSAEALAAAKIEVATAAGGDLEQTLSLPGEIALNADKVAHIVPRVAGIVRRVDKKLGDDVQVDEVMAILESRDLAEAKATYLASQQRLSLAEANMKSAEELHAKKIMPDLEFLTIQKAHAEAGIDLTTAGHRLRAIGVGARQMAGLSTTAEDLAQFELRAPFAGTVIQKHCSPGEVLTADADAFMLADLSSVRVNITVYAQDIARVRVGQTVHLRGEGIEGETAVTISYVSPLLNESTRAALARADLPNTDRRWRPGMFVNTMVAFASEQVRVLVPLDSIQRMENSSVVFVAEGDGFEARPVVVGRSNAAAAEIVSGLEPGERYVTNGAFMVKADLVKGAVSHEH